jgi:hypothetical protein
LPAIIIVYDWVYREIPIRGLVKKCRSEYLPFFLIAIFYLFVYVRIFPNSAVSNNALIGATATAHAQAIMHIFSSYLIGLFFPFLTRSIPPLFAPKIAPLVSFQSILSLTITAAFCIVLCISRAKSKHLFFFLSWFIISFVPVSNIIPLANPMAYRFVYLPSVGITALMALFFTKLHDHIKKIGVTANIGDVVTVGFIIMCILLTVSFNALWKNNVRLAKSWVKEFPWHEKGYKTLGFEYYRMKRCDLANNYLKKAEQLGSIDPRVYFCLAACSKQDEYRQKKYLQQAKDLLKTIK